MKIKSSEVQVFIRLITNQGITSKFRFLYWANLSKLNDFRRNRKWSILSDSLNPRSKDWRRPLINKNCSNSSAIYGAGKKKEKVIVFEQHRTNEALALWWELFPFDTVRKLNVFKTFKTSWASSERLMYLQFTSYIQGVISSLSFVFRNVIESSENRVGSKTAALNDPTSFLWIGSRISI